MTGWRDGLVLFVTLLSAAALGSRANAQNPAAAGNPVVVENQHPGTTDWLLAGHQEIRSPDKQPWQRLRAIEGYCSHASIRAGETLTFFVSTDPASAYRLEIYRLGYYGGQGGRLMLSLGPLAGRPQPTPEDGPQALIECQWEPSATLEIPRDWLSGVYLGKLVAEQADAQAYVIFVVRDDRPADLIFQCSDLTWQAYNRWPAWRSLYDFGESRWHTEPGNDVGFDRPYGIYYNGLPANYYPITNGSGEFLLWEFPLAYWLEKEGYDLTYISNLDTHADPEGLLRAKGFLSVGHDEYWSQDMLDHVSAARDAGVGLAFLSGNSVYTKVYINPSTEGAARRTFGRIERFSNEQQLVGASSYGVGMADWVCVAPEHWVFSGTGMRNGDSIRDLVGWEYHGEPLKEDPSLVVLATSPLRDKADDPPQAATIYEGAGGNIVFNAGTCWWSMALSSPPGYVNPRNRDFREDDKRVQQITRNVLDRMIQK